MPPNDALSSSESTDPLADRLLSRGFQSLLTTQMLGAINDNMFRWLVIGIGKSYMPDDSAVILSAGLACFVLPYLLLAAPAGYLADRYSKRSVIVSCKAAELVIMALGIVAIGSGSIFALFAVVFLMGSQSALFGPAKLGAIPELVRAEKISVANGVLGLTTVIATVIGAAAGNLLTMATAPRGLTHLWISALALFGVAIAGLIASLGITRLTPANPALRFPWNAATKTVQDLKALVANRGMFRVAIGIAFFWSLGSLAQMNIDQFGMEGGMLTASGEQNQAQLIPLLISLVVGVGVGSVLAGLWSGGRVELGILPLGAGGIILSAVMLFTVEGDLVTASGWTPMQGWACLWLFTLGTSAGLFDVPLASYMQHRSPKTQRGAILASSNFLTFAGMLAAAGIYVILRWNVADAASGEVHHLFSARQIFLLLAIVTVPVLLYVVWLLPQATMRFCAWLASHTVYRVTVHGRENLPEMGGALLVANHVSWIDSLLLLLSSSRLLRVVAYEGYIDAWWIRRLAKTMRVIPVREGPKSIHAAIETARQAIADGELVCIFPEGGVSRTGRLQTFKRGLMKIVEGTDAPVIPVYLDGMWGSIFSYRDGRLFWKRPRQWPYPVSILFGKPIRRPEDVQQVRRAVEALGVEAAGLRKESSMNLPVAFLKQCRRRGGRAKIADSSGMEVSGRQLLLKTLVTRRLLRRTVLKNGARYVGVLLPPSAGGVVINAALPLCGRIPVNLNYTVSSDVMNQCIRQCEITHVLTSRRVMEKLDLDIDAQVVYLEDLKEQITLADKLCSALGAYATPVGLLARQFGVHRCDPDDVFTVIFTSGSTGDPKGVMLTSKNIASNVEAIDQVVHLRDDDVLVGILPFFHSFGFTITLWTVLTLPIKGIYHFTPLDARQVGKLCGKHGATILLATPTFLSSYLRRCSPEDFIALDVVVTGAERLPVDLADAFEKKFGVRPVEGYGATELSPLAAVNVPPSRALGDREEGVRSGTVGRPIPNVMAKTVHLETGEDLAVGDEGMLWITGPNVMKGYLGREEATAEVLQEGWYVTGDIAKIDAEGFIQITGRKSRFSKIGGEMVPHIRIEEILAQLLAEASSDEEESDCDEGELKAIVTAVPHAKKGERLVVVHVAMRLSPQTLCQGLQSAGLPSLWVPSSESFVEVDELPLLGTGKLDLKAIQQIAADKFGT